MSENLRTDPLARLLCEAAANKIEQLTALLAAWLQSGAMVGADLDKLRADTEAALQ